MITKLTKVEEVSIIKAELFDFQKKTLEWLKKKNPITTPAPNDMIDLDAEKEID